MNTPPISEATELRHKAEFDERRRLLLALGITPGANGNDWNVHNKNFALIVMQIMSILGMNNLQKSITDMGDLQKSQAMGQGDLTSLGSLLSFLEGSVVKGSGRIGAGIYSGGASNLYGSIFNSKGVLSAIDGLNGLKSGFWGNASNVATLTNAMKSLFQLFHSNTNSSLPTLANLSITVGNEKIYADGHGTGPLHNLLKNYLAKITAANPCLSQGISSPNSATPNVSLAIVYVVNKLQVGLNGLNAGSAASTIQNAGGVNYLMDHYNPKSWNSISTGLSGLYNALQNPIGKVKNEDGKTWYANIQVGSDTNSNNEGNLPEPGDSLWAVLTSSISGAGYDWSSWGNPSATDGYSNWTFTAGAFDIMAANYYTQENQTNGDGKSSLLSQFYNSVSSAQSLFSTQTTQNNADLQQYSSQLTSFDQIGQNIATSEGKSESFMVQNKG